MNKDFAVPIEILGVQAGVYEGNSYQTLTCRYDGNTIGKMSAVADFDFTSYKDKGVVLLACELRVRDSRFVLRATSVVDEK